MLKSRGLVRAYIAIKQNFIDLYFINTLYAFIYFYTGFLKYIFMYFCTYVLLTLKGIHNILLSGENKVESHIIIIWYEKCVCVSDQ